MFFILTSKWLLGFFYHHQNLASVFDLSFALSTISPFFMMIKVICLKFLQSEISQVDLLVATVYLNFF